MISANNVTLRIGKKALFEDVNIKFKATAMVLLVQTVPASQHFLKYLQDRLNRVKVM